MRRYIKYLKYIFRHKYFVLKACRKTGTSFWRGLIHDMSKFSPAEFGPYARTFYTPDGSKQYKESVEFAEAWNHHQKSGRHHWQYYLITWDRGETQALEMPEKYAREMVADWISAGKVITGKTETKTWYKKQAGKIKLHSDTAKFVEELMDKIPGLE